MLGDIDAPRRTRLAREAALSHIRTMESVIFVARGGLIPVPGAVDYYGVVSTISDITARRAAEEALRDSEERFRQTFELAASGIAHVDLEGRFLRVNRSLCEIFGYRQDELVGRTVRDVSHPADLGSTDAGRLAFFGPAYPDSVQFFKQAVFGLHHRKRVLREEVPDVGVCPDGRPPDLVTRIRAGDLGLEALEQTPCEGPTGLGAGNLAAAY